MKKVIWLVGSSQGIGFELTKYLLNSEYYVIASSRTAESEEALLNLRNLYSSHLRLLNLDVSNTERIPEKVAEAINCFGKIDVWVYNAGYYQPTKLSDSTDEIFQNTLNVNFLGCAYLMHALLNQAAELIPSQWFWNISLASQFGLPYGGSYSASKAALLNLAESLKPELEQRNIQLRVINHGFVKTRLTLKNDFPMPGLMSAESAAQSISQFIQAPPKHSFELTFPWGMTLFLKFLKHIPYRMAFYITRKALKND